MLGLRAIAQKMSLQFKEGNYLSPDLELKRAEQTAAFFESFPVWMLVYRSEPLSAVYISKEMAASMNRSGGFIDSGDEFHSVHNCDLATAAFRLDTFLQFKAGNTDAREHFGTLLLANEVGLMVNSLGFVLSQDEEGQVTYFVHLYSPQNQACIANAYAFCDPDLLTKRQKEVFHLLLENHTPAKIATELNISMKTLEKHLTAIYSLTKEPNQLSLIAKCLSAAA